MQQPPESGEPLRFGLLTDVSFMFIGTVLAAVQLLFGLDGSIRSVSEYLDRLPEAVTTGGIYALCGLLLILGTQRIATTFDPATRKVTRTRHILFVVPIYSRSFPFAKIRYIDLDHPSSRALPWDRFNYLFNYNWMDMFGSLFSEAAHGQPYEMYLFMENRDRFLIDVSFGRKKIAESGEKIARMTGKRLT